ncbi:MAG TPA: aminoglycoside phosphotransferase family protein [Streptosporangiaceae bacterium]|nr:aminoglycoside phosphotransferase family protein [Streptosporangiaceae bacterium]
MITDDVRRGIENGGGPEGRAWIGALPAIVDRVCAAWSLTTGPVLEGGKAALVMRVRRSGKDAVLKIAPPGVEFASEIATIAAAGGRGYVRLLAHDLSVNAALLEPLGDTLQASPSSVADKLDVLAATLIQAWRTPKPPATGRHKAADLIEDIAADWERLGHPGSGALKDTAIEYARRRLDATGAQTVLCHGDPHPANALAVTRPRPGAESGYVFVDPAGFICEPAYDLGVTVRSFTGEVLACDDPVTLLRAWCAMLAGTTGADAQAIWEWALIERVSSGLFLMICGHHDEGRAHLDSAEHLIR